ncbi:MAG: CoA transferase [Ilumatobacteraceae bacterium]
MRAALSDVSVVELSRDVAVRYCGKLFADLDADVVVLGRSAPGHGDEYDEGDDPLLGAFDVNKRSVLLDAPFGTAPADLWTLLGHADLVIEAPGAGSLAAWGTSWDEVHARYPQLCVARISGFGADGPYAAYKSADIIAQAVSGTLLAPEDQDPVRLPGRLCECFTGNMAAVGALGAVTLARSTGTGTFVDCAAVEALASMPSRATVLLSHEYRGGVGTANATGLTLIPTGVFPCADGYVAMMSTPQQLAEMLDVLDDDNLRSAFARPDAFERGDTKEFIDAALYPWLFAHTRAEATALAQDAGWPMAGVNTPAEVLAADHLHQRGFWVHADHPRHGSIDVPGAPWRLSEGGWALRRLDPEPGAHAVQEVAEATRRARASTPRPPRRLPLDGVRIVDFTAVWAGPYAAMLLADLGAEVIRVENPWVLPPTTKGYHPRPAISNPGKLGSGYGPPAPGRPDRPWNRHSMNNSISRNKLSCTIDTRRPEGHELLMRLVERSDAFIENFKAIGLDRIGISVDELRRRNPRLVVLRMPPTGFTGDWSRYIGFGAQFDGLTGMLSVLGHADADPTTTPVTTYMDAASGPAAAFATMAGLAHRDATGRGLTVELAQSENVINHLADVYRGAQLGVAPARIGNRDPVRAPQGLYPCAGDGTFLAVSIGDTAEWRALADVIGRQDLAADPQLATATGRRQRHDELDDAIRAWTTTVERDAAFHRLQQLGVPAGPQLDDRGFIADPQIQARGWMRPLTTTDVGTHRHPSHPFRGVPLAWRRGSPALGEDNDYVYREILGVDDEEFEHYRRTNILAEDYLTPDGTPY